MRPLIGIPCHEDFRQHSGRPIYCNNRTYTHALESVGGIAVLIPIFNDLTALESLLTRLDGLLFSGGADIEPDRYNGETHLQLGEVDPRLDEFELMLAHWAFQENIPILGVCRGMQLLNVALGGSLYQDINEQRPSSIQHCKRDLPRNTLIHSVHVDEGSRMEEILGTNEFWVNSLHHQAIKTPGKNVHISGWAEDGVAELMEARDYDFVMAIQCHPEEIFSSEPACTRLFSAFVKACSERSTSFARHDPTLIQKMAISA